MRAGTVFDGSALLWLDLALVSAVSCWPDGRISTDDEYNSFAVNQLGGLGRTLIV